MMRVRLIAVVAAVAAAALVLVVFGTGAGDDHKGDYKVRAIFTNAFTVIPGEDVKISGVKVGKISALDVTPDNKAAVVLDITEAGFKDFRKDATCTIRPQSLIGERFVECTPTQPRAVGDAQAPELNQIKHGAGKGEYLLPASQTIKPVDLDLVGNIMRLPYRQRLSIIINELGTGLAANGAQLRQAVKQADPALQQTDRVLAILADQNKTLAQLAKNGDEVLRPLARDKAHVADFIVKADKTAVASAERRSDIEASLQKLPAFLQELKPTMRHLGGLADQMTPVLTDLHAAAPQLNQFIKQLGPFSAAATPALTSLGDAADVGDQALIKAKPIAGDLRDFAGQAKPTVQNLDALLTSLKSTGGIERLMDFLYFSGTSTNGYDSLGHYLRAVFVLTSCTTYATTPTPGCAANFAKPAASASAARAASKRDKRAKRSAPAAKVDLPASLFPGQPAAPSAPASGAAPAATTPATSEAGGGDTQQQPSSAAPAAGAPAGASTTTPASGATSATPPSSAASQTLLDYLLGG